MLSMMSTYCSHIYVNIYRLDSNSIIHAINDTITILLAAVIYIIITIIYNRINFALLQSFIIKTHKRKMENNKRKRLSGGARKKIKNNLTQLLQATNTNSANQFENVEINEEYHHFNPSQTTVQCNGPSPSTSRQLYPFVTIQNTTDHIHNIEQNDALKIQLCRWSGQYNITHSAMKDLLSILNNSSVSSIALPSDPRTLLNTPRKSIIQQNKFC